MSEEAVLYAVADGVAEITLNRPKALNALDATLAAGLDEATRKAEADASVRCVVIVAAGEHFMAGGDLRWFQALMADTPRERRRETFEGLIAGIHLTMLRLRRMRKPVVAGVQGACAGFGLSLAMACDLAVAAEDAYFTLAYVNIGTSPDGSSTFFLPRAVGMKRALELTLLGDRFDAARAAEMGLVNRVVPAAALQDEVKALARRLADGPTHAIANAKMLLNQSLSNSLETQMQREAESFADCTGTEDWEEGIAAFLERRRPEFKGR